MNYLSQVYRIIQILISGNTFFPLIVLHRPVWHAALLHGGSAQRALPAEARWKRLGVGVASGPFVQNE